MLNFMKNQKKKAVIASRDTHIGPVDTAGVGIRESACGKTESKVRWHTSWVLNGGVWSVFNSSNGFIPLVPSLSLRGSSDSGKAGGPSLDRSCEGERRGREEGEGLVWVCGRLGRSGRLDFAGQREGAAKSGSGRRIAATAEPAHQGHERSGRGDQKQPSGAKPTGPQARARATKRARGPHTRAREAKKEEGEERRGEAGNFILNINEEYGGRRTTTGYMC
ncbi:hypothetical protein DFH07DRAFT_1023503 [Mycena maculata]|uniref:Uncharacterized protein n=1 Tax=Mycena maculata TaxID=230809 RepID=A0AAD7J8T8_9AGAR|nr:hypothetical protein DFH07DRAFT_1023503 [Mycena maculata]